MACKWSKSCYVYPLATVVIALSCVFLGLTAHELASITSFTQVTEAGIVNGTGTCLLSATGKDHSVCKYAYAAGAISLILAVAMIIIQIIITSVCGGRDEDGCCAQCMGNVIKFVNTIVAIAMGIFWLVASAFFSNEYVGAEKAKLPKHEPRQAVVAMAWVLCIVWFMFMLSDMCGSCCTCCCNSSDEEEAPKKRKYQASADTYRAMKY